MELILVAILCLLVFSYFIVDSRFKGIAKEIDACSENYEYLITQSKVVMDNYIPVDTGVKLPNDVMHDCVID